MIKEVRVMRGPNIWAKSHQNIIALKLDLDRITEEQWILIEHFKEYSCTRRG